MPDFDSNLRPIITNGDPQPSGAPYNPSIPTILPGFENLASEVTDKSNNFGTLDDLMSRPVKSTTTIPYSIPYKEVAEHSRYAMYNPSVGNMEDYAAHGQSWSSQIGNALVKMGAITLGTFAESLFSIPDTIKAIKDGDFSATYNNPNEQAIDNWLKNLEDEFPNYYSDWQQEHPFLSAIPFVHSGEGFWNFWGDKVLKNLGFTAGAIGGAVVQDLAIGLVTDGIGEIPAVAAQVGKASLWLSKIMTGTNDLKTVLAEAKTAGATAEQILNYKKVGEIAAGLRVGDKLRYGLNMYAASRTEGGVEARDGYNTVRNDLISQYQKDNGGFSPEGQDLKEIEDYAKASANVRMAGNLALLTVSNSIQLDNILKPFKSARSIRGSVKMELEEEAASLVPGSIDKFAVEGGLKNNIWRTAKKVLPSIVAEGPIEEGGQFALQMGTQKYYEDKYDYFKHPSKEKGDFDPLHELIESTNYGLAQEFGTNEGLENVILGALTAVITGGITGGVDRLRGTYDNKTQKTLNLLNSQSLTGTFSDHYKSANNSLAALQDMQKAVDEDNIFEYKNLKHKEFFNFIHTAIKAGRFDVRLEQLKMLSELPEKEFKELFDIEGNETNRKTVGEYVGKLIANANKIKSTYDSLGNVFRNPFRAGSMKDNSPERVIEAAKHVAFEDTKTQLAYLSSIDADLTSRMADIQRDVSSISPHIHLDLLNQLTTEKGLKATRDEYLEQSKIHEESSATMTGKEKKELQRKAQDYRNLAERINLHLQQPQNEIEREKLFDNLLHFELNHQTTDRTIAVPREKIPDLYVYGADSEMITRNRKEAAEYYDALSGEEGFNNYFKKRLETPLEPAINPKAKPEETTFEEGRTYSARKNQYRTKKTPDGKFSTVDSNGNIVNKFDTQAEARQNTKEMNLNTQVLKVIQTNEDGTVKVELKNGDIVNIPASKLTDFESVETDEEKQLRLAKEAETIKEQEEKPDTPVTTPKEKPAFESAKKADPILFAATITIGYDEVPKPHHLRANYFGAILPSLKNRENVRGIVVNEGLEEKYGLKGLTALVKGTYTPAGGWNEDNLPLIMVAVEKDGEKYYFLDAYGERVGELGTQADINLLVFQTMATPSLVDSEGHDRHRAHSNKDELKKLQASYKEKRKQLLSDSPANRVFHITASFGKLKKDVKTDGKHPVSAAVADTTSQVIFVSTTADQNMSNAHQSVKAPLGNVFLKNDSTIQQLNNRKLTENEVETVFQAMKVIAGYADRKDLHNQEYLDIVDALKGLVYWGSPNNKAGKNSIWFDKGLYHFGQDGSTVIFTQQSVIDSEEKIKGFLRDMYNNVNASKLSPTFFSAPFNELIGFKDDKPQIREWKNYQEYLISDRYPGSKIPDRNIDEIPLTTNMPAILPAGVTKLTAQTREGIYFVMEELTKELYNVVQTEKPKASSTSTATGGSVFDALRAKVEAEKAEKNTPPSATIKETAPTGKQISDFADRIAAGEKMTSPEDLQFYDNNRKAIEKLLGEKAKGQKEGDKLGEYTFKDGKWQYQQSDGKWRPASQESIDRLKNPETSTTETSQAPTEGNRGEVIGKYFMEKYPTGFRTMGEATNVDRLERSKDRFTQDEKNMVSELSALKNKSSATQPTEGTKPIEGESADVAFFKKIMRRPGPSGRNPEYRLEGQLSTAPENWKEVSKWIEKNLPGIPVYRVKNLLHVIGDSYAWGAYSEGAIYLYENAELGTFYHEVYHAVTRNFVDAKEQTEIYSEFRARKGSFTEYATGEQINYSDATDNQINEQLAEEFRGVVLHNKNQTFVGKIGQFFKDLLNFIKAIFNRDDKIQTLFTKIQAGKYRNYTTGRGELGIINIESANDLVAPEYMLAPGEQHDIIQQMTGALTRYLFSTSKSLFSLGKLNKTDIYNKIFEITHQFIVSDWQADADEKLASGEYTQEQRDEIYAERNDLEAKLVDNWDKLVADHEIAMRAFDVEFDENDEINLKNENNTGRESGQDAMKVDVIRKSSMAIKLLFATLKQVVGTGIQGENILQNVQAVSSSVGGEVLVNTGKTFVQTLNKLADTPYFDTMIQRLVEQAQDDPTYVGLFLRLGGSRAHGTIRWDSLTENDLRLLISFFKTFSKQQPDVKMHYVLEDGTAMIRSGNAASQIDQLVQSWTSGMIDAAKKGNSYLKYDRPKGDKQGGYYSEKGAASKVAINTPDRRVAFLNNLGIDITIDDYNKFNPAQRAEFGEIVKGIVTSLNKGVKIITVTGQTLNMTGRLNKLGELIGEARNPEFDNTFFNVDGELQQAFVEKNYASHFAEVINSVKNIKELTDSNFGYLLTDVFTRNSLLIKELFDEYGNRTSKKLSIGYVNGTVNQQNGKRTPTDKLTKGARLLQEINTNLSGYYYLLVPAESSTEWMIEIGNLLNTKDFQFNKGWDKIYEIFGNYLVSEVELVREGRQNVQSPDSLRFMGFLGDKLDDDIASNKSAQDVYRDNKEYVDSKVKEFIEERNKDLKEQLLKYQLLTFDKQNNYFFENLNTTDSGLTNKTFSDSSLDVFLTYINANHAISVIEIHKTIFGDPHAYKDALKRFKSFLSPRESTVHSSPQINRLADKFYNKVGGTQLQSGDIGYHEFKDWVPTAALADIQIQSDLYKDDIIEAEADAQGLIIDSYNREFRIKAGLWDLDTDEVQYRYDKAWERNQKAGLNEDFPTDKPIPYRDDKLRQIDEEILDKGNPYILTTYYPLKPIATGNKLDKKYNSPVLDKYSLAPISYRMHMEFNKDANILKLYEKMSKEDIGYVIFESGRKVGNEFSNQAYDADGNISQEPYKGVVNVPYEILGIQVQTAPKVDPKQTLGTQETKLSSLDFLDNGVPIDYEGKEWDKLTEDEKRQQSILYNEIAHNNEILSAMFENGYQELLDDLGISDKNGTFEVADKSKVVKTLRNQVLSRESNTNIIQALDYFENNELSLESTNVYQQFKNILFSIVDRNIVSSKVMGGPKVQIASSFFENKRIVKGKDKNGKTLYGSTDLKSYEDADGKRHIEVYISSHWLRRQLPKSFDKLSDAELYQKLDQGILKGIGFRIPTQGMNSTDVFVIKAFLPRELGDAVVVPSEMVKKTGSDFDIDKLSTYLKNIYIGKDNQIKSVPFLGLDKAALESIADEILDNRKANLEETKIKTETFLEGIRHIQAEETLSDVTGEIIKLSSEEGRKGLKDKLIKQLYKASLQNEYYNSLERLISHPKNFERLIKPNDASLLKGLAAKILALKGQESADNVRPERLLDKVFLSGVRHNFVTGNKSVGIAASFQVGHALRQKAKIYIDPERLKGMDPELSDWLGNGLLRFGSHLFNTVNVDGKMQASLSGVKTKNGKYYISDIISMAIDGGVDIAKGAWLVDLLGDIRKMSPFLFMTELGFDPKLTSYFLNQPIIEDYLEKIDNKGYNWLFIDTFVKELQEDKKYMIKPGTVLPEQIDVLKLEKNVGQKQFDNLGKAEQQLILQEFLKIAKMGNHLFLFNMGLTWDTTDFMDPYVVFKKNRQLEKARETIISSPDKILNSTFEGSMRRAVSNSRNAIATYLPTDSLKIRTIIEKTLDRFIDQSNRQFVLTAKKVVNSFMDFAIHTHFNMQNSIRRTMVNDGGVATELKNFIEALPRDHALNSNPFIEKVKYLLGDRTNNLKIAGNTSAVYDQNVIINSLRELKDNPLTQKLYPQILRLSLLQGLGNSPISFTQLLPVEDLKNVMAPVFEALDSIEDLDKFSDLYSYERNNWNDKNLVPEQREWKFSNRAGFEKELMIYAKLPKGTEGYFNRNVIVLDALSRNSDADVMTITFKKPFDEQGQPYDKERIEEMRKAGDYSYIERMLVQKIKDPLTGKRLETTYRMGNRIGTNLYYKVINAWGNSFRLQEYYTDPRPSQVENGYRKVPTELADNFIADVIKQRLPNNNEEAPQAQPKVISSPEAPAIKKTAKSEEELRQEAIAAGYEPNEVKMEKINGKNVAVVTFYTPEKIKKGFSKFYSKTTGDYIYERYGKKVVVPGFEDIDLRMEQDTNSIYEMTTGSYIKTEQTTQKAIMVELKDLFSKKNVKSVISKTGKFGFNVSNDFPDKDINYTEGECS